MSVLTFCAPPALDTHPEPGEAKPETQPWMHPGGGEFGKYAKGHGRSRALTRMIVCQD
jgi:hypothetical protein